MATNPTPEPILAPPPKTVTPLDPPVILYNKKWRVPPFIVETQEDLDALDITEWTQNPPGNVTPQSFPKLFFNVNLAPKIVDTADEAAALGDEWREFNLPEALVKAAQAKLDAAAAPPA